MRNKNGFKRVLAVVLAFVLAVGMVTQVAWASSSQSERPAPGFAADGEDESQVVSDTNHLDADETEMELEPELETETPDDLPQVEVQTTTPAALTAMPLYDTIAPTLITTPLFFDKMSTGTGDGWEWNATTAMGIFTFPTLQLPENTYSKQTNA